MFNSLFRSNRVKKTLDEFALTNDIVIDKNMSWKLSDGTICYIIDTGAITWFLSRDLTSPILQFVKEKTIFGKEKFLIILVDLDSKFNYKIDINVFSNAINIYNLNPQIDTDRIVDELKNKTLFLVSSGFYGPIQNIFTIYATNKQKYVEFVGQMSNFTPYGITCAQTQTRLNTLVCLDFFASFTDLASIFIKNTA